MVSGFLPRLPGFPMRAPQANHNGNPRRNQNDGKGRRLWFADLGSAPDFLQVNTHVSDSFPFRFNVKKCLNWGLIAQIDYLGKLVKIVMIYAAVQVTSG